MKKCTSCKNEKLEGDFYKDKSQLDGLTKQCKSCRKLWSKLSHEKNKEQRNFNRKYRLIKDLYGLDYNQYQTMLTEQNHSCTICNIVMKKPVVDHCHSTGKVRSLLCQHCNSMIGFAKENINTLKSAIKYLEDQ